MPFRLSVKLVLLVLGCAAIGGLLLCPIASSDKELPNVNPELLDMSMFSSDPPTRQLRLLFIHHSCGGQWMAPPGENQGEHCIYESAENGGGLRAALTADGYEVHEASYTSVIGDKTDIFDWPTKFSSQMDKILACDHQDTFYDDERRNNIVMFKSCFPNNQFVGRGEAPGDSQGPSLTVENAKAAYLALLPEFEKHPDTLFVAVTSPPIALGSHPAYKAVARWILGRSQAVQSTGPLAREFNNWLANPRDGWLKSYSGTNVVVFDLYDVLSGGGSNFLQYPTGGYLDDSHPSSEGNQKATAEFVPFVNRAVRRAGLVRDAALVGTKTTGDSYSNTVAP